MPTFTYTGFPVGSFSVVASGQFRLQSSYDATNTFSYEVTDDDGNWSGDATTDEMSEDTSQQNTTIRDSDGNVVASGQSYLESRFSFTDENGDQVNLYAVEISGTLYGFVADGQLQPGNLYEYTVANVTNANAPAYTDLVSQTYDPDTANSILGSIGADSLVAGLGDDSVDAGDGADTVFGGDGTDTIHGGAGDDSIDAGAGDDTLRGGTGADTLEGGDDADSFVLEDTFGADSIIGGEGVTVGNDFDTIDMSAITVPVTVTLTGAGGGTITDGTGTATFTGIERLILGDSANVVDATADTSGIEIVGGDGNDSITGGSGTDTLSGGGGADTLDGGGGFNFAYGGAGDDVINNAEIAYGDDGDDTIIDTRNAFGGAGNDYIDGDSGADTLDGGTGDDTIFGGSGGDSIIGGDGADYINTGTGTDTVSGGAGSDYIDARGGGSKDVDGGADDDTILGSFSNDTLIGGSGADSIAGGGGADVLSGGDDADIFRVEDGFGADTILGGEGGTDDDALDFTAVTTGIDIDFSAEESGTATDGTDTLTFSEIERISLSGQGDTVDASAKTAAVSLDGLDGNDTLTGGTGADTLTGGAGDDLIDGGAGDDLLITGTGNDTLLGGAGNDTLRNSAGDDSLSGGVGDDSIVATLGNDTLEGGDGNDTLMGGVDNDSLDGGAGDDLLLGDLEGIAFNETGTDGVALAANIDDFPTTQLSYEITFSSEMTSGRAVFASYATTDDDNEFLLDEVAGVLRVQIDGQTFNTSIASAPLFDGELHTLGVTWDSATGTINVFVDGVSADSGTVATGFVLEQGGTFALGQEQDAVGGGFETNELFKGTIYGTRLYNDIRTPTEIASSVSGPRADMTDTNLVANWVADSTTGGFVDQTGSHAVTLSGDTALSFSNGDDILRGGQGADTIFGGGGSDTVLVEDGFGNDSIIGGETGTDDDVIDFSAVGSAVSVAFTASEAGTVTDGTDTLSFSETERLILTGQDDDLDASNDFAGISVASGAGGDSITGGGGADTILGEEGDDNIQGQDGDDSLSGGSGSDTLFGQGGNDTLLGGDDSDLIVVDADGDTDVIDGGEGGIGDDTLAFDGFSFDTFTTEAVTVTLTGDEAGTYTFGNGTGGTFTAIEAIEGTDGNDTIDGSAASVAQSYSGADGVDQITGGAGDDTILGGDGTDHLRGGAGDDSLVGGTDGVGDRFYLGAGHGNDTIVDDGTGRIDTRDEGLTADVTATYSSDGTGSLGSSDGTVTFSGIGTLVTGAGDDNLDASTTTTGVYLTAGDGQNTVIGGAGGDDLRGGAGNDSLVGNDGDDYFETRGGSDTVIGGAGDDYLSISSSPGSQTHFDGGTGEDTVFGSDQVETADLGSGNDMAFTSGGSDTVNAGGGADTIGTGDDADLIEIEDGFNGTEVSGGEGVTTGTDQDRLDFSTTTTGLTVTFSGDEAGSAATGADTLTFSEIEDFSLTEQNDSVDASATTAGTSIDGLGGNDTLTGGAGNDDLDGDGGADNLLGGAGNDTLRGGDGDDTLEGGTGTDFLRGEDGADRFVVRDDFDRLFIFGGSFDAAEDLVDLSNLTDGVTVDYSFGDTGSIEQGTSSISFFQIEKIILTDAADQVDASTTFEGVNIEARDGDDSIVTGSGNDTISVGGGNATIRSGDGDDSLTATFGGVHRFEGGAGADTIDGTNAFFASALYEASASAVAIDLANGTASGGEATGDVLLGIDEVSGSAHNDTLAGDENLNVLAGFEGDDFLSGRGGDDQIYGSDGDDTLLGGTGADSLFGEAGADLFVIEDGFGNDTIFGGDADSAKDVIDLSALTSGVTVVFSNVGGARSGTITDGIDTITFSGIERFVLTEHDDVVDATMSVGGVDVDGAGGNDSLTGSDNNDTLLGSGGADTIRGGLGDDYIEGGDGDDVLFTGEGQDTILGGAGNDTINNSEGDDSLVGGTGDDSITATGGNDTLEGGEGSDTLDGGADNDRIDGGTGDDLLTGGAGDDLFVYAPGDGADTITDFNAGNTGTLTDGDSTNNDSIDLSGFYDNIRELHADHEDDGILNQSNTTTRDGRAVDYSDNSQFGAGDSLTFQGASSDSSSFNQENTGVVCFGQGTRILTPSGQVPVERLKVGDLVTTRDNGPQPLLWSAMRRLGPDDLAVAPHLAPVEIAAHAFGNDIPLLVSPQHGILLGLGSEQTLVRAIHLARLDGGTVRQCLGCRRVTYWHLFFDSHQVVFSNGLPTESYYPGPQALHALAPDARQDLAKLLPDLSAIDDLPSAGRVYGAPMRPYSRRQMLPDHVRAFSAVR